MKIKKNLLASTIFLALSLVNCGLNGGLNGQDLEKKILGTWVANADLTKAYWEKNKLPIEERLLERASKMSMTFFKNGSLQLQVKRPDGKSSKTNASYKVEKTDKDKKALELKFLPPEEGPEPVAVTLKFLESKKRTTLAITPANDPPLVFVQKEDQQPKKKDKTESKRSEKDSDKSAVKKSFNK